MSNYTKISKNSKTKPFFLLLILLIIYIFIAANSYTQAVCNDISTNVFRLHVIANSDSEQDQNLKYLVRDSIIDYIQTITQNATSKAEVIELATVHLNEIQEIASQTIYDNGYNYSVKISVGNYAFPTKTYGDITFPPGYYDALKIEIGEAKGQNWWCVMFPPLCFVDISSGIVPDDSKEYMEENLSSEEYNLISSNNTNVKIKFKIVEVLQNLTISGIFM